jgi:hypothetical protein
VKWAEILSKTGKMEPFGPTDLGRAPDPATADARPLLSRQDFSALAGVLFSDFNFGVDHSEMRMRTFEKVVRSINHLFFSDNVTCMILHQEYLKQHEAILTWFLKNTQGVDDEIRSRVRWVLYLHGVDQKTFDASSAEEKRKLAAGVLAELVKDQKPFDDKTDEILDSWQDFSEVLFREEEPLKEQGASSIR